MPFHSASLLGECYLCCPNILNRLFKNLPICLCWGDQLAQCLLVLPSLSGHVCPSGYFSDSCSLSSTGVCNLALKNFCVGARPPVFVVSIKKKKLFCITSWFCFFLDLQHWFVSVFLRIYERRKSCYISWDTQQMKPITLIFTLVNLKILYVSWQ